MLHIENFINPAHRFQKIGIALSHAVTTGTIKDLLAFAINSCISPALAVN